MTRRFLHLLMLMALIVSVASLTHTSFTHSEQYPLCGGGSERIGAMRNRTRSCNLVSSSHIHRCPACDYEFTTP